MDGAYRVLDLTDERGQLAAQIMNFLGSDVVLVEPPGGSPVRAMPPFAGDVVDPERSLTFLAWNRGKRSVVVDLRNSAGQTELVELARNSDVVIESGAVPIDLDQLRRANPALVTVSISAFGSTGPKAEWPATDLTILAAGGQLVLTGDSDRPPVRTSEPQAFLHAAGDAACGALTALFERDRSGLGQHVDISAQRSVLFATQSHVLAAPYGSSLFHRMAGGHSIAGIDVQLLWPCKDGFVVILLLFGESFGLYTARLIEWLHDEGFCEAELVHENWISYGGRLFSGREPVERYTSIKRAIGEMCMTHTKEELLQAALAHRLLIAPTTTTGEIIDADQYADRQFWDTVDDPQIAATPVCAPGLFVRSEPDAAGLGRAPRLGEHDDEVRAERGARRATPAAFAVGSSRPQPFEGLRVVDLTWALTGPATARFLSDFGATVVHIESSRRMDSARTVQPFLHDVSTSENAAVYHNMNVGKLSASINLACPEGRAVLDDLAGWADVLIESFSPRGRAALGLDYARLSARNPGLIMLSSCLFGQEGPLSGYAGFGNMASALAGFYELTGWEDRAPAGPFSAYTDYVSPRFAIPLVLAALDERRRTGLGRYLDFSQAEAALHFLTPALLDYSVNGRVAARHGNDDPDMSPHGIYPCAGEDRWVAIACRDDADWAALAAALGRDDLAGIDTAPRLRRRRELDAVVAEWTSTRSPADVERTLIAAGVPAHGVQHSPECAADPQLAQQRHFVVVEHPHHETVTVENSRVALSDTPSELVRGAPVLGQHTIHVVTDLLGYDDERLAAFLTAGALE